MTALEKHEAQAWPARVRVRTLAENSALKPGDAVRVKATLSPPPGPALPGDYDFARAAWFQGLGAVGFAKAAAEIDAGRGASRRWRCACSAAIARVRQAIGRRIVEALPGETGAIANALITGERGGISEATNQAFRDSGLFHILSISGLHMVIMAGAVFLSIRLAAGRHPVDRAALPDQEVGGGRRHAGRARLSADLGRGVRHRALLHHDLHHVPGRDARPAGAWRCATWRWRRWRSCCVWPESLLDPGFQMSFAAVVALVSAYEWLRLRDEARGGPEQRGVLGQGGLFFGGIVTSTLVASLAVAPFGIYHFHNTQQFAILANLLAIPICNLIVMPAALAALVAMPFGLEAGPLWLMGLGIEAMVWCANAVAGLPGAVGRVPAIPDLRLRARWWWAGCGARCGARAGGSWAWCRSRSA